MIKQLKQYIEEQHIIFLPKDINFIKDSIVHTFKNVILINKEKAEIEITDIINNSNLKKIYLIGYNEIYNFILPRLKKEIEVCWIFNNSFSNLSNYNVRLELHYIFEYYDRNLIKTIGCMNKDNYEVFKNAGYNCEYIELKIDNNIKKSKKSNTIGLLSKDFDPNNNFYNQLAALTFIEYDYCKINYTLKTTKEFLNFFNIKYKKETELDNIIKDNFVNLYINFTNTNNELIYKSFNVGVPCIIGNSNIFDKNKYLKEHLVLKSDDDINEIVSKIEYVKSNKEKIINEYKKMISN